MALTHFRKESSERSDSLNWAKSLLVRHSGYALDSIEGCNQNAANQVTHLMERARVAQDSSGPSTKSGILRAIIQLEGEAALERKINFARRFALPLAYILYCVETREVFYFSIPALHKINFHQKFASFDAFAHWISKIKGWKSNKKFREIQDLPEFDKALRRAGTPWPTNIDCFISDAANMPVAILEFQNARNTHVARHCNNDYFLCKLAGTNPWGRTTYHDDIRRWTSQEILRVQSGLKLLIITWSQHENDYMIKDVGRITLPFFPSGDKHAYWETLVSYKAAMHKYANTRTRDAARHIAQKYSSYNLRYHTGKMDIYVNPPPLSYRKKTFPYIYYKSKELVQDKPESLVAKFKNILEEQ